MDVKDFFVVDKLQELEVEGLIFKYKEASTGDELDWIDDYTDEIEVENPKNPKEKILVKKQNRAKLGICKLRNIMEVPFSVEELEKITGNKNLYSDYTNEDKDALFRKLKTNVYTGLINSIKKISSNKKKD